MPQRSTQRRRGAVRRGAHLSGPGAQEVTGLDRPLEPLTALQGFRERLHGAMRRRQDALFDLTAISSASQSTRGAEAPDGVGIAQPRRSSKNVPTRSSATSTRMPGVCSIRSVGYSPAYARALEAGGSRMLAGHTPGVKTISADWGTSASSLIFEETACRSRPRFLITGQRMCLVLQRHLSSLRQPPFLVAHAPQNRLGFRCLKLL